MRDVIVIGSTTRDAFFETDFEIARWEEAPLGKALIIPFGEKFSTKNVYFTSGGNAANASFTFAQQGLRTAVFTKIGSDVAGKEILKSWKKAGVATRLVRMSNLPTSYSVLLLQNGERSIITYHGAIDEFTTKDAALKNLRSKWWYISLPGDSYKEFDRLLAYAVRNKIKVALNPSYKHLTGDGLKRLSKHLKDLRFLLVNEGEASKITGIPFKREKEVFRRLDDLVPGIVAVTSGQKGVTVSDGQHIYKAGIFKNKKVIDRTGAGDAFGSGFIAGLIRRRERFRKGLCRPENIEYAIRIASANATSVVEKLGATAGILTKKDFDTMPRFRSLKITRRPIK